MRKVKCGIENAERRWLVEAANHVTAAFPHITAALIYVYRNRQSGKMQPRNAENANTGARMHLVPDTCIIIHFVNAFMPQRRMSCTIKTRLRNFVLDHVDEK